MPAPRTRRAQAERTALMTVPEVAAIFQVTAQTIIAVGTALAGGPPHRSQRALLTHWAPALGAGVEAGDGPGVQDAGGW